VVISIIKTYYGAQERLTTRIKILKKITKYIKYEKSVVIININTVIQSGTVNK